MDFDFILPLEQQVLVKIADTLWDLQCMDRLVMIFKDNVLTKDYTVEQLVDKMMRKVLRKKISNLFLPESIKDKLVWIARNVGLQKIGHYSHHDRMWNITKLPQFYRWTSYGTIDKKKTAEHLINDDTIDIWCRYTLACAYCYEKEIRELSRELAPRVKEYVLDFRNILNAFWYKTVIKDRGRKHDQTTEAEDEDESWLWVVKNYDLRTYKDAYIYSLEAANSVAAAYFLAKLTSADYSLQERQQDNYRFLKGILYKYKNHCFRPTNNFLDVAVFLLKEMAKCQQMEVLVADTDLTLELFLDWPLQRLFFEVAELVCPNASAKNLSGVLRRILMRIRHNHKTYDYREIFTRFWSILPVSQKSDIINYCISGCSYPLYNLGYSSLFHDLLAAKYLEYILLIVRDATATQRQDLIRTSFGEYVCEALVLNKKWELLKLFIDLYLPSIDLKPKFKTLIQIYVEKKGINDIFKILGIAEDARN